MYGVKERMSMPWVVRTPTLLFIFESCAHARKHARTIQMSKSNSSMSSGFSGREREVMVMPRVDAAARMRESADSLCIC